MMVRIGLPFPQRLFGLAGLWLLMLALLPGAALAQTFPPLTGRVVDAAHVLNDQQIAELTQLSAETEQASTRQLVIATIPDLQGYDIADYGYKLGRAWKIGQEGANNGIVLIVAPNDRKVRIEVGYGLEPIMTDALSNQIIQTAIIPKFKAGDMPGGILAGAQAIAEQLKLPPEAAEQRALQAGKRRQAKGDDAAGLVFTLVILIILFVVLPMIFRRAGGRRYSGGGGMPVILWGPGFGGGGGGGSSWGGGGSDWGGGGGGGFSGGGGSFGGGGASGSW